MMSVLSAVRFRHCCGLHVQRCVLPVGALTSVLNTLFLFSALLFTLFLFLLYLVFSFHLKGFQQVLFSAKFLYFIFCGIFCS